MALQGLIAPSVLISRLMLVFGLVLAEAGHGSCFAQRNFTSDRFRYALTVPIGWNLLESPSGVPVIFNYPRAKGLPQGLIPDGGADIYLVPESVVAPVTPAGGLDEWIRSNESTSHSDIRVSRPVVRTKGTNAPQDLVKVEADYERSPDDGMLQTEVNYYFRLHGDGFRLRLLYWKGAPKASSFRAALVGILNSIRAADR